MSEKTQRRRVGQRPRVLRPDIQGLRAIAVSMVLLYHLWPNRLSGGYAGVDVFFVISGFLITTHLLSRPPADRGDLLVFWARRIRRLLPAALTVLAATLVASRLVAPETQWAGTAQQTAGAALYVVNWVLAGDAVDYLAAESAPSPVQHYWSLSIEEQFYFVWPILVLLAFYGARRSGRSERLFVIGSIGVVTFGSFIYSIHLTDVNPAAAYFVTPTRMWELGLGGLLAACVAAPWSVDLGDTAGAGRRHWWRPILAWAGLAAMVWTGIGYSAQTPFPGYQALLPTLGSVAFIAAFSTRGWLSPGWLMAWRPIQWLGDVSYSVYLWHWPLIVLLPGITGRPLERIDKVGIIIATMVLAGLTKTYIEDPYRTHRRDAAVRPVYAVAAVGMMLIVGAALLQVAEVDQRIGHAQTELQARIGGNDPCFGAAALSDSSCGRTLNGDVVPSPLTAATDRSDAYKKVDGKDCWSYLPSFPDRHCVFGATDADTRIALVGNSHAGQWLPALQVLADQEGWRIDTYLASQCAMGALRQQFETTAHSDACESWGQRTSRRITRDRPDLVIISNRISVGAEGIERAQSRPLYRDGYTEMIQLWTRAGIPVVALHDTPAPVDAGLGSVPDCVAAHADDFAPCVGLRDAWVPDDPVMEAVAGPLATAVDLTDMICRSRTCDPVVGGVVVYFDGSHLTATYARTLAPYLREPVITALGRSR